MYVSMYVGISLDKLNIHVLSAHVTNGKVSSSFGKKAPRNILAKLRLRVLSLQHVQRFL